MRATARKGAAPGSLFGVASVLVLFVLGATAGPALASVYQIYYGGGTASVAAPTVSLQAGTAGASSVSSVAPDAGSAAVTAGLTFYENANAPAACSTSSIDTSTSAPSGSSSYSISPYPYVPITITNSQTSATSANLQVEFSVDFALYPSYEASDVGNIRFYGAPSLSASNELYAWLESFAGSSTANTATSSAVWVKLPSSIGASSSATIYMVFLPTSTAFDGSYWGEASDLSSTYGQYDNGANVFLYYNNGQTTSGFSVANGGSLGTSSMADPYGTTTNVLALAGRGSTSTSAETVAWHTTGVVGDNFVVDGWIDILSTSDSSTYNANAMQAVRGASSTSLVNYLLGEGWTGKRSAIVYQSGTTSTTLATSTQSRATGWVWSTSSVSGSSLANGIYSAPSYTGGTSLATTSTTNSNIGSSSTYVGIANWAGAAGTSFFYQWKVRVYPPNGVLPTGAPGSLVTNPSTACLISPQYGASTTLYAGTWAADLWASASASGSVGVAIYTADSSGAVTGTIESGGVTGTVGTSEAEVLTSFAGSAGTVGSSGYIEVTLTAQTTGPLAVTLYWGTGQLSNFQSPNTYNYVLAIGNPSSVSWSVHLGTLAAMTSNLGRLTATLSFVSPASNQIAVTGGSLTQSSGSPATLAASGTIDIEVVVTASAVPSAANVPSTVTFSVVLAPTSSTAFAQYTVTLTIG